MRCTMFALEIRAERASGGVETGVVERRRSRDAANPVGSKKFFGHGKKPGSSTCGAGVVSRLLLSIVLAYFLDPAVDFLERMSLPRTLGAMVMVLILIAVLVAGGYGLWTRAWDFAENGPKYSGVLQQVAGAVEGKIKGIEGQVSQIAPEQGTSSTPTVRTESSIVQTLIFRGIGSLYALFLEITFMPFLSFFMLSEHREV